MPQLLLYNVVQSFRTKVLQEPYPFMLSTYDSKFEKESAEYLSTLSVVRCNDPFPVTFKDKEGTSFTALPDFIHVPTGLLIELKCADLNPKTSVRTARNAMRSREAYRAYSGKTLTNFDVIENAWSNSIYKQLIVQKELTRNNFIIVFDVLPNYVEAQRLLKAGLVWCDLRSLPSYLGFLQLQRAGIKAFTFRLSYTDNEIEHILYPAT